MDKITDSQKEKLADKSPALVLGLGALLWRLASWGSNIDFILSLREERVAVFFQFLLNWGWMILPILALLWGLVKRDTRTTYGGMTLSVGIVAFMFGALIVTYATQTPPQVVGGWGVDTNGCTEMVDTSRLTGFASGYRFATVCGVVDPSIDKIDDGRITACHIDGDLPLFNACDRASVTGLDTCTVFPSI